MADQNNTILQLEQREFVPIIKDQSVYYGGSQMWFPSDRWFSRNYVIHHYGCGTIATADLFLYLAIRKDEFRNPVTEFALQGTESVNHTDYLTFVRKIDRFYTNTKRWIAVIGPQVASAINSYFQTYELKYRAKWRLFLSFYDMLDVMEEMLSRDFPVIISIGPNTPKLWGNKGIKFYQQYTVEILKKVEKKDETANVKETVYRYREVKQDINSHYVTVTGIWKDPAAASIMLSISSWGKQYFIDYEEYREYINDYGGTITSSIVHIK